MNTVDAGFLAAGSAGKASALGGALLLDRFVCDAVRDGIGDGLLDDAAEEAQLEFARLDDAGVLDGRGGNKPPPLAEFQLPFLPTGERDDWAVELFSLSTLEPPAPSTAAALLAGTPLGPGREG